MRIWVSSNARERLRKYIANALLANTVRVCNGHTIPTTIATGADEIARKTADEILAEFRLVRRKP